MQDTEFAFTDQHFKKVQALLKARAGIELAEGKRSLVYSRLARRVRALGLRDFGAYLDAVADPGRGEATNFLNALTTNVTSFFRESHHFDYLLKVFLPELEREGRTRVRIWSAGCSSGEEPYSIASVLASFLEGRSGWDIKLLATDIDTEVLTFAHHGTYPESRIEGLPEGVLSKYFEPLGSGTNLHYRAKSSIRSLITFKQLNLLGGSWPMRGPFDAIFCRNVIIYFSQENRMELVKRYAGLLRPGGRLFLGHSESTRGEQFDLEPCGKTIYRKGGSK